MRWQIRETCEKALEEYHFLDDSQAEDASQDAANDHAAQLELLKEVFSKAALADTPTQVRSHSYDPYICIILWTSNFLLYSKL